MSKRDLSLSASDIEGSEDYTEQDEEFDYEGFEVVRREFYAHTFDPAVNFKYDSIAFNTACVNKFDTMYIHLLINPLDKKMVIRMCDEDSKDAVKWCRVHRKTQKKIPRRVLCRLFAAKLYDVLGWNPEYKYKIQGTVVKTPTEKLIVFNLNDTEIYTPVQTKEDGSKVKTTAFFPQDWKDSFGLPVDEHRNSVAIDLLSGYQSMEVTELRRARKKKVKTEDVDPNQTNLFNLLNDSDGGNNV